MLDFSNVEALCTACHNLEHKSGEVFSDEVRFTSEGNLINSPYLQNELTAQNTDGVHFKASKRIFYIRRGELKVIKNKDISLDLNQFDET